MDHEEIWFVYVLRSKKDFKHYVGLTSDLDKRIKDHNGGKVPSTSDRRPFELVYFEMFKSRSLAEKRERFFKTGDGRVVLKNLMMKLPATKASAGPPPLSSGEGDPPTV